MTARRLALAALTAALTAALVAGCSAAPVVAPAPSPSPAPSSAPSSAPSPATPTTTEPSATPTTSEPPSTEPGPPSTDGTLSEAAYGRGSAPPAWLSTRVLPETDDGYGVVRPTPQALRRRAFTLPDRVPMLPGRGYASRIVSPAPADVLARSTWTAGCPVGADQLAWLRLTFWGFDAERHTGELLVNAAAADDLDQVFRRLYAARFPLEQVVVIRSLDEEAPPTGDGNGTGSFVCRAVTGGTSYSQHAYGLAIDVNTFQNPYTKDDLVLPELASAYLDRSRVRPGMITPDGPVVAAFREIGWGWGGDWSSLKDYQHFSSNGR